MEKDLKKTICSNRQIKKFSWYGFLKNLQFFEPYLLIYLLGNNLTLLHIGFLISIREIVINIFEIPSGIFADFFGRKKALLLCFIFYIVSFIFFFFSVNFLIAAIAMVFFGFAEAFRSGTHKAMIYSYIEQKKWHNHKTFIYGKTRSSSLTGSAVSSLLAILIILHVPHSRFIFLASIIPYILDFLLILSYPQSLDKTEEVAAMSFREMLALTKRSLLDNKSLRKLLLGEGFFEAVIKSVKDFIQPILAGIILGSGVLIFKTLDAQANLQVILGVVYACIHLLSAAASRRAYLVKKMIGGTTALNLLYGLLGVILVVLGFFVHHSFFVVFLFLLLYLIFNIRKPIFVDEIGSQIKKSERATMLSISSQLKSLVVAVLAPCAGYIADAYGMYAAVFILAGFMFVTYGIVRVSYSEQNTQPT